MPGPSSAATAAGGERARYEVADIVRAYGAAYRRTHGVSPVQALALRAIARCRTAALGGHVLACDACGARQVAYNSCRNRNCPKCQGAQRMKWLAAQHAALLPVEYFHIVFTLPHALWGTDGARVLTVDDGWVWIFSAVDHWSAECVGWHVTKVGDRFAALEPIAMGLTQLFGGVEAEVARGLAPRMDHGTQYLSEHFRNQIKFWGIHASFAFVEQPETNGVAERFNRTLKEQIIHGRTYRNVEELRAAVRRFTELYNRQWRIEKRGYLSPIDAREQYALKRAA